MHHDGTLDESYEVLLANKSILFFFSTGKLDNMDVNERRERYAR